MQQGSELTPKLFDREEEGGEDVIVSFCDQVLGLEKELQRREKVDFITTNMFMG